jgi:hypothetical protein
MNACALDGSSLAMHINVNSTVTVNNGSTVNTSGNQAQMMNIRHQQVPQARMQFRR